MNGRLYDPAVGRFLNVDPVIQDPTSTQNYNRYSYCLNNPLKYVDLTGENQQFAPDPSFDRFWERTNEISNSGGASPGGMGRNNGGSVGGSFRGGGTTSNKDFWSNVLETANNYGDGEYEIAFSGNRYGVNGLWVLTVNYQGNYTGWRDGVNSPNSYMNVINKFTAFNTTSNGKERDWAENTQTGMGAFGFAHGAKEELINFAAKADASLNELGYVKAVRVFGKGVFAMQAGISIYQAGNALITDNPNKWGVTGKAGLDIAMGGVTMWVGPVGWVVGGVYFVGDLSGWWGDWGKPASYYPLNLNKN